MNFIEAIKLSNNLTYKYYPYSRLISAIKTDNEINIDYDIGFILEKIFRITIDVMTEKIIRVDTIKDPKK